MTELPSPWSAINDIEKRVSAVRSIRIEIDYTLISDRAKKQLHKWFNQGFAEHDTGEAGKIYALLCSQVGMPRILYTGSATHGALSCSYCSGFDIGDAFKPVYTAARVTNIFYPPNRVEHLERLLHAQFYDVRVNLSRKVIAELLAPLFNRDDFRACVAEARRILIEGETLEYRHGHN